MHTIYSHTQAPYKSKTKIVPVYALLAEASALFRFAVFIQIILNDLQEESAKALKDIKIGQNAIQMHTGWAELSEKKQKRWLKLNGTEQYNLNAH